MKYFVILEDELPVGVAFADPVTATFCMRSTLESLSKAFDAICARTRSRFIREKGQLKVSFYTAGDVSWMKKVLDELCSCGTWTLDVEGDVEAGEYGMDSIVKKYIGWANSEQKYEFEFNSI